jgi:hypothetical protein
MAVEDFNKYMQLAKVLNNSWGTGSQLRSSSQSIKFNLRDDRLMKASLVMIVNMPNNPRTAHEFKQRYKNEALGKIKSALEDLKKRFEQQNEKSTIRFKMLDNSVTEGVEYLTNAQYRETLHAYFRLDCLVSVE